MIANTVNVNTNANKNTLKQNAGYKKQTTDKCKRKLTTNSRQNKVNSNALRGKHRTTRAGRTQS